MEDLGAAAQSLTEGRSGDRHDHELLDLHVVGGVSAAVQDVHHGNGQLLGVGAANVVVQGDAQGLSGSLGASHGCAQDGVGAQTGLVGGTVQLDHSLIDGDLIQNVHADQALSDLSIDILHGSLAALAQVAGLVAVTQLAGLVDAGGSAGGNGSAAHGTVFQINLDLDGGVAAAVQDLATQNVNNFDHLLHWNQTPFKFSAGIHPPLSQGGVIS